MRIPTTVPCYIHLALLSALTGGTLAQGAAFRAHKRAADVLRGGVWQGQERGGEQAQEAGTTRSSTPAQRPTQALQTSKCRHPHSPACLRGDCDRG